MRTLTTLIIALLIAGTGHTYQFILKGKISNPNGSATLSTYTTANPFIISTKPNKKGEFLFKGQFPVATRMMITYKDDSLESGYELFLFETDTIIMNLDAQTEAWQLEGVSPLSEKGYEHVNDVYLAFSRNLWDDEMAFQKMEDSLIVFLGGDELARVAAKSIKFFYMDLMVTQEMKRIYNIYENEDFINLPKNKAQFSGMHWYTDLMRNYNRKILVDSLKAKQNDSNYFPPFNVLLPEIEKRKDLYPKTIYLELKRTSFYSYIDNEASEKLREQYITGIEKFLKDYPAFVNNESLKSRLNSVKYSLVNKPAPEFKLADTTGKLHKFPDLKGKYILLDVWGSWCAPCRFYNKHLVEMYDAMKDSLPIDFISIAYDSDLKEWKRAITEDNLAWPQLLYSDAFVDTYNITVYPTMYLISPDGIVLKKAVQIREEDIFEFLKQ